MDLLKNIFKGDKVIWIIFLCLCLISIIEVFSAASTLTYKSGDHWGPITQHSIILMVGAVVVVFLHNVPLQMVPGISGLSISGISGSTGICHADGHYHRRPCQQGRPLDDLYGITIPAIGIGKDGGYHCRLIHPYPKGRTNMGPTERLQIYHDPHRTGIPAHRTGKPFDSNAAVRSSMHDDVYRTGIFKKLFGMLGILGLVGGVAVGILMAIPAKHCTTLRDFTVSKRGRIVFPVSLRRRKCRAKFDIDKDAQIAHARIAIATSHVVGKGLGNSIQRDFLSQAFPILSSRL